MKFSPKDGRVTFDEHFNQIYGSRWPVLRAALLAPSAAEKVTLTNPFGLQDYSLDRASLLPATCLQVLAGERVADFCSAPGGKLLSMIFSQPLAAFSAWDLSPARVTRLKAVLHDCLPSEILARVEVRRGDAARIGQRSRDFFDRILVDAPCSGERHLLHSPQELARWTLKSSKRLAIRQNALLCSALDAVKPGGRIVYSTCSISPLENDGVVDRLGESRPDGFTILPPAMSELGEPTRYGRLILPDRDSCGPIYTAILQKRD